MEVGSVRLMPYTEFDTDDLAEMLHELVNSSREHLKQRRLVGVVMRYGLTLDLAKVKVEKGQRETADSSLGHFAVLKSGEGVVGAASVFPGLALIKATLPVNPKILPSFLRTDYRYANPNVSAWASIGHQDVLSESYRELRSMTRKFIPASGIREIPWTIEPNDSPKYVHDSIEHSGLNRVATRFYYDGESRYFVGLSTLYANTSNWVTSIGHHHELSTGDWHGSTEEIMSRNPRGY